MHLDLRFFHAENMNKPSTVYTERILDAKEYKCYEIIKKVINLHIIVFRYIIFL